MSLHLCTAALGRVLELYAQESLARAVLREVSGLEGDASEGSGGWILPTLHCDERAFQAM